MMNRIFLICTLATAALFLFTTTPQTQAQTGIYLIGGVEYNVGSQTVGGYAGTYITYDMLDYYDPWVDGKLTYENPYELIDRQQGEGINDAIFPFLGYYVDFTSEDYRPNKLLCTFTDHRLRAKNTGPPLFTEWSDPYQIDKLTPIYHIGTEYFLEVTSQFTESLAPRPLLPAGNMELCIQTPTVEKVTFETINSQVTEDNPSHLGGGYRIFPDRQTLTSNEPNRRIVRVKASLAPYFPGAPQVPNVPVFFKNFDIDDPSSDSVIDANGNTGNDNRGARDVQGNWTPQSAGQLVVPSGSTSCGTFAGGVCVRTNENGEAIAEFTVTMQPGDNFVIAASTDSNYLGGVIVNGTGLQDSSGSQLQTNSGRARRSQMLSVWRKLHIETDSMGNVTNNKETGQIINARAIPPSFNVIEVVLDRRLEEKRFQPGSLVVANVGKFQVGTHIYDPDLQTDTLTIPASVSNAASLIGQSYTLYDDDNFNNNSGALGDIGEDVVPLSDTLSRIQSSLNSSQNMFADAYVLPVQNGGGSASNNNDDIPFNLNVEDSEVLLQIGQGRDSNSNEADDYWVAYIQIGYQPGIDKDADPNFATVADTGDVGGNTPALTGNIASSTIPVPLGGQGSLIYIETISDYIRSQQITERGLTVVHELGHQFGIEGHRTNDGVMKKAIGLVQTADEKFVPDHINMIRWRIKSPGF
ncbi:MAG: hypothetical protein M3384_03335 [Acidobacteriota bacterium]|nr:hypothetical protein [Acidobacteriota bacterium]